MRKLLFSYYKLFFWTVSCCVGCWAGMHKKSMEASQKLKEEELTAAAAGGDGALVAGRHHDVEERRSESIKLLRAKAQSYSAAARLMMHGVLHATDVTSAQRHGHVTGHAPASGFQSPVVAMVTTGC